MSPGRHLCADLAQMLGHGFAIHRRHDDGRSDGSIRTDGAEQIGGVVAIVAHRNRARPAGSPDVSQCALLPNSGFVLKPHLDRLVGGSLRHSLAYQGDKVFLYASWAAASFFG